MHGRRTIAAALGALLLSTAACGTQAQHSAAPSTAASVDISTAITAQRTSSVSVEGYEPTSTTVALIPPVTSVPATAPVGCTDTAPWPSDAVSASDAERCDYRVLGGRCEEDEVCAVQQIRDTGDFTGTR